MRKTFALGHLVITPGAMRVLSQDDVNAAITRHKRGDWGDLDDEDKVQNDTAVQVGERILSAYLSEKGEKFWIITERDRSVTTILLPSEY